MVESSLHKISTSRDHDSNMPPNAKSFSRAKNNSQKCWHRGFEKCWNAKESRNPESGKNVVETNTIWVKAFCSLNKLVLYDSWAYKVDSWPFILYYATLQSTLYKPTLQPLHHQLSHLTYSWVTAMNVPAKKRKKDDPDIG